MSARRWLTGLGLSLVWMVTSCSGSSPAVSTTPATPTPESPEMQALFSRLAPPTVTGDEAPRLVLRDGPAVPDANTAPLSIAIVPKPTVAPPTGNVAPLKVLSYAPTGRDDLTGAIRITFDQPMVPVAQLRALQVMDAPIEITPTVPGKVRWLGTKTLAFEPAAGRLPLATDYTVKVPAGTRSVLGGALQRELSFPIKTPVPSLVEHSPHDGAEGVVRQPWLVLRFNQKIDPRVVAEKLRVEGGTRANWSVVSAEELSAKRSEHPEVGEVDDRTAVLKADAELAAGSNYRVVLPAGFVGAEGPKPTTEAQSFAFRTIDPLRVEGVRCGWGTCVPGAPVFIELNNPIATANAEIKPLIKVQPAAGDLEARVEGNLVQLYGAFSARTTYRVQLAAGVRDIHGQTLARPFSGSITVGDANPELAIELQRISTLERTSPREIGARAVNVKQLRARMAAVPRDALVQALRAIDEHRPWDATASDPFAAARLAATTKVITSRAAPNAQTQLMVPIEGVVPAGQSGYALVQVEARQENLDSRALSLVQVTDLNAIVTGDATSILVRVLSLSSAQPVAGATVDVLGWGSDQSVVKGTTDAHGVARLSGVGEGQWLVRVSHADDQAIVATWFGGRPEEIVGTLITDRDPYRPGDTVHFKLLARTRGQSAQADAQVPASGTPVSCILHDAQYQQRQTFEGTLSAYGAFAGRAEIVQGAALGHWHINCSIGDQQSQVSGTFQVQEYRAPEIEASVHAPEGTFFHGDAATFRIESRYLFGANAAALPADYTTMITPEHYAPAGHADFHFGDEPRFPMPWLRGDMAMTRMGRAKMRGPVPGYDVGGESGVSGRVVLDTQGAATVVVPLTAGQERGPVRVQLEAAVTDLSRQQVANRASVIAHPSAVYVGVKADRTFVADDESIGAALIAVGVDGANLSGRKISTRLLREIGTPSWHPFRGLSYDVEEKEVATCEATSAEQAQRCTFKPQQPGRYTLEASSTDERGRVGRTRVVVWVYGAGIRPWFSETPSVEISADKESYAVGETAKLLVRAPIANGRGLLSIERRGIVESRVIDLDGSIQMMEVPITSGYVPNVTVRLSLARGRLSDQDVASLLQGLGGEARRAAAEDIGRPMHVAGSIDLQVKRDSKRFAVSVTPDQATHQPGEEMGVTVQVNEPNGQAADADVTLMAVDEAVLSLLGYTTPDPLPSLLAPVYSVTSLEAIASTLLRRIPLAQIATAQEEGTLAASGMGVGGGGLARRNKAAPMAPPMADMAVAESSQRQSGNAAPPATARTLFATTAYYLASATTTGGKVNVRFKLPDNLTRFRLMAIAVGRTDHAGSGESHVTVQKPLLLRPALPRVASFGDRFDASVIVHNETGAEREITIGVRAAGLSVQGEAIVRQRLAAGEAREVSFPVVADTAKGTARVQFAAMTEGANDAVETELPLIEPATSEAFATYGSLTGDAVRYPLQVPEDAIGRFGGLELSLSSTALTDLSDGVDYLLDYPYECAEQLASRLIGAASLSVALAGRDDERAAVMRRVATTAVAQLQALRRYDGSFNLWPGDQRDGQWRITTTAWVGLALHEASLAQVEVPARMREGAAQFLSERLNNMSSYERVWPWDQALAAYALSQLGGEVPTAVIETLWQKRATMPMFARAWLASVLKSSHPRRVEELLRLLRNGAVETAAGSHFAESESEGERFMWHSDHRTDAIVLRSLLDVAPSDPLIEKTARGLVAARRNGRWHTTQENAWALSALTRYYRVAERETPDMTARAWLGEALLSETELRGRKTPTLSATLPMATLQELGSGNLTIGKDGEGRLYYRVGLRYAPNTLLHDPEEQGFAVTRVFESIGEAGDVTRDGEGQWHIKAGANVRVRLTVVVPDTRYDVALDDPLAAGLEPLNLGFATTASQALGEAAEDQSMPIPMWGFRCWLPWAFHHRELRDDRVTAFSDVVSPGVYELVYLARATTPGRFIAAPTKIEEMYAPETFARGGSDVVIVER